MYVHRHINIYIYMYLYVYMLIPLTRLEHYSLSFLRHNGNHTVGT